MGSMLPPVSFGDHNEPDADEQNTSAPPDQDQDDSGAVKPEWVQYTTEAERCQSCEYMDEGGMCSVLKMPVQPMDHCSAFEPKQEQQQGMEGAPQMQAPQPQEQP